MKNKVKFYELQRFPNWLLFLIGAGGTICALLLFVSQDLAGRSFFNAVFDGTWFVLLLSALLPLFFCLLKLETNIDASAIHIRYFPFVNRKINWSEVARAEVIDYGFVGGWGIRLWTKYGTVYNTKGRIGLFLQLKNGKKCCIGTQKEAEMRATVNALLP